MTQAVQHALEEIKKMIDESMQARTIVVPFSARDIARRCGISNHTATELMRDAGLEYVNGQWRVSIYQAV